jgi:hypothetical protein
MPKDKPLDALQLKALDKYDGGEFAHLKDETEEGAITRSMNDCGDTLLTFVLKELSDAGGNINEAIRMMYSAANQLQALAFHFEQED